MEKRMQHLVFNNLSCAIHYWYRKGTEDKWVLFFHGAGVDHEMFQEQYKIFDDTYNIIAWDNRGHGLSKLESNTQFRFKDMISDCKKIYEIYNINKAVLIGQSIGGNLVQEIAYNYSEMVEKLVLIDCTKNTGKLTFAEKCLLKSSRFLFNCYSWKTLIKQSANACANKVEVRKYIEECFKRMDKETFIDILMDSTACLHYDPQYKFKQPVLLLCGTDERTGNIKKVAEQWAKSDSSCTLHFINNAGHNSNQDNPEMVNALIRDFLDI
ncbi:MAG: alpha/beta hydrolase [Bacillota bacterium]|nr:alpha/beta hydrolase [Bacillota bacterium]